ncbi:MAG: leucine-rich repeat domain-containing protein, partial [Ruminococcus sp.]
MKNVRKRKKIQAFLLTLFYMMWQVCSNALLSEAYDAAEGNGDYFTDGVLAYQKIDSFDMLRVVAAVTAVSGEYQVPASISGMSVTEIGENAFSGMTELTSVVLPDTVLKIGSEAFRGCTGLADISVEGTVQSVGANAFADTAWSAEHESDEIRIVDDTVLVSVSEEVTELIVPESVRVIADDACANKNALQSAVLT